MYFQHNIQSTILITSISPLEHLHQAGYFKLFSKIWRIPSESVVHQALYFFSNLSLVRVQLQI
jgi:hypothetical protein